MNFSVQIGLKILSDIFPKTIVKKCIYVGVQIKYANHILFGLSQNQVPEGTDWAWLLLILTMQLEKIWNYKLEQLNNSVWE